MRLAAALIFAASTAVALPSGLTPELRDVLVDQIDTQTWVRFRFVVPELGASHAQAKTFDDVADDFPALCANLALPYLNEHQITADRVVISFSDQPVEFGASAPDVTQFFEQFRIEAGHCIWEGF